MNLATINFFTTQGFDFNHTFELQSLESSDWKKVVKHLLIEIYTV